MAEQVMDSEQRYREAFRGSFTSALRWQNLDSLWRCLREQAGDDWYIYAIGEAPPGEQASKAVLLAFIEEIDQLLRAEHEHDYCGIVYADDLKKPSFIKIYDPHNLGVSCGYSDNPPLPGWVLSKLRPCEIHSGSILPGSRKRWWRRLFGAA